MLRGRERERERDNLFGMCLFEIEINNVEIM